jgi:hypothetical protein
MQYDGKTETGSGTKRGGLRQGTKKNTGVSGIWTDITFYDEYTRCRRFCSLDEILPEDGVVKRHWKRITAPQIDIRKSASDT